MWGKPQSDLERRLARLSSLRQIEIITWGPPHKDLELEIERLREKIRNEREVDDK